MVATAWLLSLPAALAPEFEPPEFVPAAVMPGTGFAAAPGLIDAGGAAAAVTGGLAGAGTIAAGGGSTVTVDDATAPEAPRAAEVA